MNLDNKYRRAVRSKLLQERQTWGANRDKAFAISKGINPAIFSRLKKGEVEGIISEQQWLTLGRELDVFINKKPWVAARTYVYEQIEAGIKTCKENSQSKILVDHCGIGKSLTAQRIIKTLPNAYYIDISQHKTKIQFIRNLAKLLGIESKRKVAEVLADVKYAINLIDNPVFVLDELGDGEYSLVLLIKELWNSSEGNAGWYMMGAQGLQAKIDKGIASRKVGWAELFSRFSGEYIRITPEAPHEKQEFWRDLYREVAEANVKNPSENRDKINNIIKKAQASGADLRFVKDIIIQNKLQ